jgi:hypothetical protein
MKTPPTAPDWFTPSVIEYELPALIKDGLMGELRPLRPTPP